MKKVLVTGNAGLIGRALTKALLKRAYIVIGVDWHKCDEDFKPTKHYLCDINDHDKFNSILSTEDPDYIIHLAARIDLNGKSVDEYQTNTTAVKNLVEQTSTLPNLNRIIYTSSMLVCKAGYVPKYDTDYFATTPYGESKVITEKHVRNYEHTTDWVLVRPTTVWGPYINEHYLSFLRLLKKRLYFHSSSKPLYKSYSFVENIAFQYIKIMEAESSQVHKKTFYLADYTPLSLREYTTKLALSVGGKKPITLPLWLASILAKLGDLTKVLGLPSPFNSFRLNNILTEYQFNTDELQKITGPLPVDFMEGINKTAKWFSQEKQN
ncbi:NAD-dependent epimerase/dehydratase family protein [Marinoscillum furvescens]|uniref:Nucleoside-diphosphate-sugar epimerase n=1 Tax=Marinoscillum furvescens DSM 4134 TaxID=1122208 RepID=A0A3D9KZS6_MARFU|nr:NAD(P)-dependent oxidoreductase [Marinoscillum furvescens]RED96147.1 nucleoside-diphosphate-sugar epimerase [Marinoscillum furvescens DSM 4134]